MRQTNRKSFTHHNARFTGHIQIASLENIGVIKTAASPPVSILPVISVVRDVDPGIIPAIDRTGRCPVRTKRRSRGRHICTTAATSTCGSLPQQGIVLRDATVGRPGQHPRGEALPIGRQPSREHPVDGDQFGVPGRVAGGVDLIGSVGNHHAAAATIRPVLDLAAWLIPAPTLLVRIAKDEDAADGNLPNVQGRPGDLQSLPHVAFLHLGISGQLLPFVDRCHTIESMFVCYLPSQLALFTHEPMNGRGCHGGESCKVKVK